LGFFKKDCLAAARFFYLGRFLDLFWVGKYYILTSMWRKIAIALPVLTFAFIVLFASILRTAAVKYEFQETSKSQESTLVLGEETSSVDYFLAYPGKVLPDSTLWPVKALRDRVWLFITTNPSRKAELNVLFADKRLGAAKILFEKKKPEIAYSTLTKAEKYLEEAAIQERMNNQKGIDTSEFLQSLSRAALKHVEVMEGLMTVAPEDAKPGIIRTEDYAKRVYNDARNALMEKGLQPPENPFDWN